MYGFFHEYAALESSLGLKLVLSKAAQWDGQWEWREDSPLPVTQLYMEQMNTSSLATKPKGLHHVQEGIKCCCSLFFMPGSYFLLKIHFIRMLQLSALDKRNGRKADLLPVKVLHLWHHITDLLRN